MKVNGRLVKIVRLKTLFKKLDSIRNYILMNMDILGEYLEEIELISFKVGLDLVEVNNGNNN